MGIPGEEKGSEGWSRPTREGSIEVLIPHIPRIQTPRHRAICRTFNDRTTIGKHRHLKRFAPKLQHKLVVPHCAMGREPFIQLGEVNRSLPLMNLYRIPAAQRNVRTAFSGQMNELPFPAHAAICTRFIGGDLRMLVAPHVKRQKTAPQS